ncbi:signal peptidase II [Nitrospira sp. BLG_2]|uniref:signal peptidase II n=1 Tax=Nitrospira sp. BLG_2 TaxID=3397507 RepID=UPI003B9B2FAC
MRLTRDLLILLLLVGCVGCDQLTKDVAQQYLAFESPRSWFYDTVRLEYAENTGAFLSLGSGFPEGLRVILFQVFPALWLVGLGVFLFAKQMPLLSTVAWSLILSGGIGNLLDRLLHDGRVIDFMNVGIGGLRSGIFNVADACITIGLSLLVLEVFRRPRVSVNE